MNKECCKFMQESDLPQEGGFPPDWITIFDESDTSEVKEIDKEIVLEYLKNLADE